MSFLPGKNAKELGIDLTRKFVVVDAEVSFAQVGDILSLARDDDSWFPFFNNETRGNGEQKYSCVYWYQLDYAPNEL